MRIYTYQPRKKSPGNITLVSKVLGIICCIVIIYLFSKISLKEFSETKEIVSPFVEILSTHTPKLTPTPTPNLQLKKIVDTALSGTEGMYGVVIQSLKTDEHYMTNEHKGYESGSLYKLWVMGGVYEQINSGKLSEDKILSQDVTILNREFLIDPENAELTSGTITLTVHDALYQMITISHNYAALLLTETAGLPELDAYLSAHGFTESKIGTNGDVPTTTPSDIALFFEKLYKNQLADEKTTEKMLSLLKDQQLNDKIPKYLPGSIKVAHKTGELDDYSHDAGIIYGPKGDYILVVFSKSDSPLDADKRIAALSQAVYTYFAK